MTKLVSQRDDLHELQDAEYLGDGVYMAHDDFGVWLRTERQNGWHELYLEPDMVEALTAYVARVHALRTARQGRE